MTASGGGTTPRAQAAVWCGTCGIPYAAETVYCANCGAPLAAFTVDAATTAADFPALDDREVSTTSQGETIGASQPAALVAPDVAPPLAVSVPQHLSGVLRVESSPVASSGVRTLDEVFPRPPRGLLDRVRQRQQGMSDDEIDAAAAAIIAQARHADRLDAAVDAPHAAQALLADFAPDPAAEDALRQRQTRDRAWLIGGIVCCVILILFALVISRSMSVGLLRQ